MASTDLDPRRYGEHRQAESDATDTASAELANAIRRRKTSEAGMARVDLDLTDTEREIADTLEGRP